MFHYLSRWIRSPKKAVFHLKFSFFRLNYSFLREKEKQNSFEFFTRIFMIKRIKRFVFCAWCYQAVVSVFTTSFGAGKYFCLIKSSHGCSSRRRLFCLQKVMEWMNGASERRFNPFFSFHSSKKAVDGFLFTHHFDEWWSLLWRIAERFILRF